MEKCYERVWHESKEQPSVKHWVTITSEFVTGHEVWLCGSDQSI